jgi:hypothetical protein
MNKIVIMREKKQIVFREIVFFQPLVGTTPVANGVRVFFIIPT